MLYTDHYNLNLPEGTDIVNPLVQDNPNYSAIDTAMYANKLRVIGTATEIKTGTVHALTRADQDIAAFKFVATSDYTTGDTFTVDGVTVTARVADGSSIPNGAFKINSTVEAILDGTILNLINVPGTVSAGLVSYDNSGSGLNSNDVQGAIDDICSDVESFVPVALIGCTMQTIHNAYTKKVGHLRYIYLDVTIEKSSSQPQLQLPFTCAGVYMDITAMNVPKLDDVVVSSDRVYLTFEDGITENKRVRCSGIVMC